MLETSPTPETAGLYLAHVQDLFSRLIVGWSMADHLRSELVVDALEMALYRRCPERGLIHHSDMGCQYTAVLDMVIERHFALRAGWRRLGLLTWRPIG